MRDCNVLIVGSGLSGRSAAFHLARLGVKDVIVLERMSGAQYDHYHHTCGEAVSYRMLDLAGVSRRSIIHDVRSIRITYEDIDIDWSVKGAIIDRVDLLEELKDGSDAQFIKESVIDVRGSDDGYIVQGVNDQYRCRYLIGADGVFSIVRKRMFGTEPRFCFPCVNNIVVGEGEKDVLRFTISPQYPGCYRWDFPAKDRYRSIGYSDGTDHVDGYVDRGKRYIAVGKSEKAVKDNCCIIGDAAILANPICFGGIGAALISGRKVAERIAKGDLSGYQSWLNRDRMFDHHFLDALVEFRTWNDEDYCDAIEPLRKGASIPRGFLAIVRRPKWANVYMSIWVAFNRGW